MKKYKCMNIPNCDFANTGEVFDIAEGESLICPKCKSEMVVEVKPDINWKLVGGITAVVALIGGAAGAYFGLKGDKIKQDPKPPYVVVVDSDSIAHIQDSLSVIKESLEKQQMDSLRVIKDSLEKQREDSLRVLKDSLEKMSKQRDFQKDPKDSSPSSTSSDTSIKPAPPRTINLGYGIYEGPTSGGKAHGIGGTIRFTRTYSIDLKKIDGETVEVYAGDKMVNVKMDNNRIIQGLLKRSDGSERWIIIG